MRVRSDHTGIPPAQRRVAVWRSNWAYVAAVFVLAVLFIIVLSVFLHQVIVENIYKVPSRRDWLAGTPQWLWELRLPNIETSLTLLIGVATLIFTRHHFALGSLPYLNYISSYEFKTNLITDFRQPVLWSITIRNAGSGNAIIRSVYYRVAFEEDNIDIDSKEFRREFKNKNTREYVTKQMKRCNCEPDRDYSILNLSPGYVLRPNDEVRLFESSISCARRLFALDAEITFSGILGDTYKREVYCIPREGLRINESSSEGYTNSTMPGIFSVESQEHLE